MPYSLRTLAFLALLLPALVVPRGLMLSLCLCGYGLDAAVCVAQLGCEDGDVGCACTSVGTTGEEHAGDPAGGAPCAHAAHDAACPHCHTVSLDEPSIDFVACPASDVPTVSLTLAPSFDLVTRVPPMGHTVSALGRAPPLGGRASPGLWPGVRPLRI